MSYYFVPRTATGNLVTPRVELALTTKETSRWDHLGYDTT